MMPVFLIGKALEYFLAKIEGSKFNFQDICKILADKFKRDINLVSLDLAGATKLHSESYLNFPLRLTNMVATAYLELDVQAKEFISLDKFLDGISRKLRISILKDRSIEDIEKAAQICTLHENICKKEEENSVTRVSQDSKAELSNQIARINIKLDSVVVDNRRKKESTTSLVLTC